MAIIKAGTYRFNDVLTQSVGGYLFDGTFTVTTIIPSLGEVMLYCTDLYQEPAGQTASVSYKALSSTPDLTEYGFTFPIEPYLYSNNDGWDTANYGEGIQTITIPKDTDVSDEFEPWFTANTKPVLASIQYNGSTIASLFGGDTATLKCEGMRMESDVVVEVKEQKIVPLTVTENGVYDAVYEVGTETWDSNTEYSGSVTVDGVTLNFKKAKNLIVPDDLSELADDKYRCQLFTTESDYGEAPLNLHLDGVDGVYVSFFDYAVLWVKSADLLNAQLGINFIEDNTVYITNYLQLVFAQQGDPICKVTVIAPVGKADGYYPVTVDVKQEAIVGAWKFDTYEEYDTTVVDIPLDTKYNGEYAVNFSCVYNGETKNCVRFRYDRDDQRGGIQIAFFDADDNFYPLVSTGSDTPHLEGSVLTTIDFGAEPQVVHLLLKELMTKSATRQEESAGGGAVVTANVKRLTITQATATADGTTLTIGA